MVELAEPRAPAAAVDSAVLAARVEPPVREPVVPPEAVERSELMVASERVASPEAVERVAGPEAVELAERRAQKMPRPTRPRTRAQTAMRLPTRWKMRRARATEPYACVERAK